MGFTKPNADPAYAVGLAPPAVDTITITSALGNEAVSQRLRPLRFWEWPSYHSLMVEGIGPTTVTIGWQRPLTDEERTRYAERCRDTLTD